MFFSRINAAVRLSSDQGREGDEPSQNEIDKKEKKDEIKSSILKAAKKAKMENKHIQVCVHCMRWTVYCAYIIAEFRSYREAFSIQTIRHCLYIRRTHCPDGNFQCYCIFMYIDGRDSSGCSDISLDNRKSHHPDHGCHYPWSLLS